MAPPPALCDHLLALAGRSPAPGEPYPQQSLIKSHKMGLTCPSTRSSCQEPSPSSPRTGSPFLQRPQARAASPAWSSHITSPVSMPVSRGTRTVTLPFSQATFRGGPAGLWVGAGGGGSGIRDICLRDTHKRDPNPECVPLDRGNIPMSPQHTFMHSDLFGNS